MPRAIRSNRLAILSRTGTRTLVLALAALSAGCGGGDKAAGPVDAALVGTYALVALNDRPLPAVLYPGRSLSAAVVDGAITLRGDRTYVQTELRRDYRADGSTVAGSDHALTSRGTFTQRGSALAFTVDAGGSPIGPLDGGTATIAGARLTYLEPHVAGVSSPVYTYEKR